MAITGRDVGRAWQFDNNSIGSTGFHFLSTDGLHAAGSNSSLSARPPGGACMLRMHLTAVGWMLAHTIHSPQAHLGSTRARTLFECASPPNRRLPQMLAMGVHFMRLFVARVFGLSWICVDWVPVGEPPVHGGVETIQNNTMRTALRLHAGGTA